MLADRLGIQRSTLSHLFAGRNKPGFDFLQKLSSEFPELDMKWVVTGEGQMLNVKQPVAEPSPEPEAVIRHTPSDKKTLFPETSPYDLFTSGSENKPEEPEPVKTESFYPEKGKKAVKVVMLFDDGSFEEYHR